MTVALLGADGAGKSTIGHDLPRALRQPSTYLYMGINLESSNVVLPTTRLFLTIKGKWGGRPDMAAGPPDASRPTRDLSPSARATRWVKMMLRTLNLIAEEWSRQLVIWRRLKNGQVVVLDRHFYFDYFRYDVEPRATLPLIRRLHGFLLARVYPRPDVVIVLDAPAEMLFARKGEGTLAALDQRRQDYLQLRDHARLASAVVDASQPRHVVLAQVAAFVEAQMAQGVPTTLRGRTAPSRALRSR